MNMLVMFAFIFALGIVVDDAIVVIENTHRIHKKTRLDITSSAKYAAGEVFLPILSILQLPESEPRLLPTHTQMQHFAAQAKTK